MLTKKEIKQLHNNLKVIREEEIANIPFVISSFDWRMEGNFVDSFSELDRSDNDLYVRNYVSTEVVKQCLISFNGEKKSNEEIENFSIEKINFILDKYHELSEDITDYLQDFPQQELDTKEVEEFILTDKISRTISFSHEEDVSPIKFRYELLNVKENKDIGKILKEKLDELDKPTNIKKDYIENIAYATRAIKSINGIEITEKNIQDIGVELIKFVLKRMNDLEKEIRETLTDSKKVGQEIKN